MDSVSIKATEKTLIKMKKFYDSQMISTDQPDIIFKAEMIGCTITAYTSMEVVFEGIRANEASVHWVKEPKAKAKVTPSNKDESGIFIQKHIGSDDVGNTDYFGPICTVACYVSEEDIQWLKTLNLPSDPKTLPATEIVQLAKVIKERILYSLLILDNPHYNKMISEGINNAHLKARLHNQAITNIMQRLNTPVATKVVEQFVASKTYYNYLKNEVIVVKDLTFEKNAHASYYAVVCAHILARYASLQYFNNMSRSLKVKLPYGANGAVDQVALKLVAQHGENILNKVAKKNMNNTKRVLEMMK